MNPPTFDPDDPRLTAYALGETSEAERQEIEQLLVEHPEARPELEATRELARGLEGAFQRERDLYDEMRVPANVVALPVPHRAAWKSAARQAWKIAAVLVVLGTVTTFTLWRTPAGRSLADGDRPLMSVPEANDVAPSVPKLELGMTQGRALVAVATPPPHAALAPAPDAPPKLEQSPRDLLAMAAPPAPAGTANEPAATTSENARPASQQRAFAAAKSAVDTERRATGGAMPRSVSPAVSSVDRARVAPPSETADARLRQTLVSVREPDGSYIPGVIVSGDGTVLTGPGRLEEGTLQLTLADGREFTVRSAGGEDDSSFGHLHLPLGQYPTATPASGMPHSGAEVVVVLFERSSGKFNLVRYRTNVAGQVVPPELALDGVDAQFAFDKNGGLLVGEARDLAMRKAAPSAAAIRGEARSTSRTLRPLNAQELAPPR